MPSEKFRTALQTKHYHLVQSSLVHLGMTVQGVQQVLQGHPLTSPSDRMALASYLHNVMRPRASSIDWNEPKHVPRVHTTPRF